MTIATFDTLRFVERLTAAGIPEAHARAEANALSEALQTGGKDLVTKEYLDARLEKELSPVRADLAVVKWMLGLLLAGVLAIILRTFFPH